MNAHMKAHLDIHYPHLLTEENFDSRCLYTFHRFLKFNHDLYETERIRTALRETAFEIGVSEAYLAKILVENGLQAPKHCFPKDFVAFIEGKSNLDPWAAGAMSYAQNKLAKKWRIPLTQEFLHREVQPIHFV